MGMLTMR